MDLNLLKAEVLDNPDDIELAEDALSRHHYLGSKRLEGKRMRYVITYRGEWVALLFFEEATLHSQVRDEEIGWDVETRKRRNKYMTNNCRFMIGAQYKGVQNLGSKCLWLVERRISEDWQRRYGHPILAVETFVDPEKGYEGSCYKGAGWKNLGLTKGYRYADGTVSSHKYYFVKPLHAESYAALRGEWEHPLITGARPVHGSSPNFVFDPNKIDFKSLRKVIASIPDPRAARGKRYEFVPMLSLIIAAALCGYTQFRQIRDWIAGLSPELRAKSGLRGDRTPSEAMIGTLLKRIQGEKLDEAFCGWLRKFGGSLAGKVVSLDGKLQRGTGPGVPKQKKFLNVIVNDLGIVIKQLPVSPRGMEQPEGRQAIRELDVEGSIITADAIHASAATAREVVKKKRVFSSLSKQISQLS